MSKPLSPPVTATVYVARAKANLHSVLNVEEALSRLKALRESGRLNDPANEAVADTYLDMAVYAVLAYAMQRQP